MEFITEIDKKGKLRTFWRWEVQTQKITMMIFILTYKKMSWHINTASIILHQSGTERCAYHAENRPALAPHEETSNNYKHEE